MPLHSLISGGQAAMGAGRVPAHAPRAVTHSYSARSKLSATTRPRTPLLATIAARSLISGVALSLCACHRRSAGLGVCRRWRRVA